jgi:DNA repair protein RecN (Recombination protein N)
MTALTGETGAGKTMLVERDRAARSAAAPTPRWCRPGAVEAVVEGRFDVGGEELVLTRIVPAEGRSRAYVDGRLATVATLAEIAADIVDLHGQHAHQSLLSTATQRAALDEFGGIDLGPLRATRARLTEIDAELAALGGDERARAREIDLLRFQVDELDAAAVVDPDEDQALDTEETVLADATAHREAAAAAAAALGDDGGARDALSSALGALDGRAPFSESASRLRDLLAEVDDLVAGVRSAGESIDEAPERLAEIRERRQTLKNLRRKYGDDLASVMAFHAEARGPSPRAGGVRSARSRARRAATSGAGRRAGGRRVGRSPTTSRRPEARRSGRGRTPTAGDATRGTRRGGRRPRRRPSGRSCAVPVGRQPRLTAAPADAGGVRRRTRQGDALAAPRAVVGVRR